jgi:phosphotransferase system enzyme I (PtsI)
MKFVKGIMVSPGIAIGKAFLYAGHSDIVPSYEVAPAQIAGEMARFGEALQKAVQELEDLRSRARPETGDVERKFLDSHILMLRDPELLERVQRQLAEQKKNVEWVLQRVIAAITAKLVSSGNEYVRERSADIQDVYSRILGHLLKAQRVSLNSLPEDCVLVAHNLLPSDLISMDKKKVTGLASDAGGRTSHVAILARSFAIPAVFGLSELSASVRNGDTLIVDGTRGVVIVSPDEATERQYQSSREAWLKHELQLLPFSELRAETRDGKLIQLESNIEVPEETDSSLAHGADGVGLFRSEFLYIIPKRFPTEEEQLQAYTRVLEAMKPRSVTIRTLDLGGEKIIPGVTPGGESNPILGWRAVRFCISRPQIFKAQLRALLRASVHGNLKIMFPMISGVEELDATLELLEEAKQELTVRGQAFAQDIPVGIMIEVPSAAFTSDILARRVSFFSIGTNDLIQYMIAVDRENERIAYLYEPFHPAVLRLLKTVIDNAHASGIPAGMCGEMAADPYAAVVLLGLGLDEFSMSSIAIPETKRIIRSVTLAEAEELAGTILEMKSYREVDRFVRSWMEERFEFIGSY